MGWGPSATYTIEHVDGWKVEDFRISDITIERAEKGLLYPRSKICREIRQRVEEKTGKDPDFIYYDDLTFTKVHVIPAAAKRAAAMKAAADTRKTTHSVTQNSRR